MIDLIKLELQKTLPGKTIQYRMAPSDRVIREQAVNLKEIKKVLYLFYYSTKMTNYTFY